MLLANSAIRESILWTQRRKKNDKQWIQSPSGLSNWMFWVLNLLWATKETARNWYQQKANNRTVSSNGFCWYIHWGDFKPNIQKNISGGSWSYVACLRTFPHCEDGFEVHQTKTYRSPHSSCRRSPGGGEPWLTWVVLRTLWLERESWGAYNV